VLGGAVLVAVGSTGVGVSVTTGVTVGASVAVGIGVGVTVGAAVGSIGVAVGRMLVVGVSRTRMAGARAGSGWAR
jgi:hypothetical protein